MFYNTRNLISGLCLLLSSSMLFSQVGKGDYILDFNAFVGISNLEPKEPSFTSSITYLRFITDRVMVGGRTSFAQGHVVSPASSDLRYFKINNFQISPAVRYYFGAGKWAPFASLENVVSFRNVEEGPLQENSTGSEAIAGLGFNYILGQNITLETNLQSNVVGFGTAKNNTRYLSLNAGVKLLFSDKWTNQIDSISSKVLKRGVFLTSSTFGFRQTFNNFSHTQFQISPNIKYFLTDRLNVSAQLSYFHFGADETNLRSIRVGLGVERYFNLTGGLFLNVSASSALDLLSGTVLSSTKLLSIPLEVGLSYFANQKRWYVGARYSYLNSIGNSSTGGHSNDVALIGGVDYYVLDNVFVRANLNLNISKGNENFLPESRSGALNLGVGFLLDRNKIQF